MNVFPPPSAPTQDYVQGAMLQMSGDQGAVLLCAEDHERFCSPPPTAPAQDYVEGAMLQGVLLVSVWLRPMCVCVCGWVHLRH